MIPPPLPIYICKKNPFAPNKQTNKVEVEGQIRRRKHLKLKMDMRKFIIGAIVLLFLFFPSKYLIVAKLLAGDIFRVIMLLLE